MTELDALKLKFGEEVIVQNSWEAPRFGTIVAVIDADFDVDNAMSMLNLSSEEEARKFTFDGPIIIVCINYYKTLEIWDAPKVHLNRSNWDELCNVRRK